MIQDVPKIGRVYQLTPGSVSPTRPAGRDANGIPREEVICVLAKHELFVDTSGNVCTVPLQCGRVFDASPEAERIEIMTRRDQIKAGCLPLNECPHTTKYVDWVGEADGGMLMPVHAEAPLSKPCFGKKQPADQPAGVPFYGCEHMEAVIMRRRAVARTRHDALQTASADERTLGIAREVGAGIAHALPGARGRQRMAEGKGEE